MKTIRIIAALAAVLLLAGCILQPEAEDTGSISLSIEAPEASVAASAVTLGSGGRDAGGRDGGARMGVRQRR
jgi:ABC-type uncharacterized transport system auxiliary subunit